MWEHYHVCTAATQHSKSELEQILLQIEQFYSKTVLSIKIPIWLGENVGKDKCDLFLVLTL